jgi:hypothetical protein
MEQPTDGWCPLRCPPERGQEAVVGDLVAVGMLGPERVVSVVPG